MQTSLMLDAPCYMLDATMLQKDAKRSFQKKFSTKVGGKSGSKKVIFMLLGERSHQKMLDANKLYA